MVTAEEVVGEVIRKHPPCSAWTVPITFLRQPEREFFQGMSPQPLSAIVVGRRIMAMAEWTWYEREDGSHHCEADDHAAAVCEEIRSALAAKGYRAGILPYPGECGLLFREVARAAGAGEIGTSAFLLHPEWGPWIQLRVMETDAPSGCVSAQAPRRGICDRCGDCILSCPAGAVGDGSFDGKRCREYRTGRGEYIPFGPKREFRYCTICADVCPTGKRPM